MLSPRPKPEGHSPGEESGRSSLLLGPHVIFRSSTDWMRPTHKEKDNLLTQSPDSNANRIQKHPPDTPRNNICVWAPHGPVKLT